MNDIITDLRPVREYLSRIGAHTVSIRSAVIREREGVYWRDIARIRIMEDGAVKAPKEYMPDEQESLEIRNAVSSAKLLRLEPPYDLSSFPHEGELFEFHQEDGKILMVQERITHDKGKSYIPWTRWSDGEWRKLEPDGELPLYNARSLSKFSTVFIHEGPKTVARLLEFLAAGDHPWQAELSDAAHVGWIGGALNPGRTDWKSITQAGTNFAYIVADNDRPGREAVARISRQLRCVTRWIRFPASFPVGFDLGDQWDGKWPGFRSVVCPATFLTDMIPPPEGEKGRPHAVLRPHARSEWQYIEEGHLYVHTAEPDNLISADQFNTIVAPYSHVDNTRRIIDKERSDRSTRVAYMPGEPPGAIYRNGPAFNTHVGSDTKELEGDASLWIQYMEGLVPDEAEREFLMDWVSTLVAHPGIRMEIAVLMIGGYGIGKTTLGQDILAPLLGRRNVSFPGDKDVLGDFNEWAAHKRLAVVNEIHVGRGEKIYEQLKTIITDRIITVNRKYFRQYETDCWCHIYACSNHEDALSMKHGDRRWFMPSLRQENPHSEEWWRKFHSWLKDGEGLGVILGWARRRNSFIAEGRHAPMTSFKAATVSLMENEEIKRSRYLAEEIAGRAGKWCVDLPTVKAWLKQGARGGFMPNDNEIVRAMKDEGLQPLPGDARLKINQKTPRLIGNQAMLDAIASVPDRGGRRKVAQEGRIVDLKGFLAENEEF